MTKKKKCISLDTCYIVPEVQLAQYFLVSAEFLEWYLFYWYNSDMAYEAEVQQDKFTEEDRQFENEKREKMRKLMNE